MNRGVAGVTACLSSRKDGIKTHTVLQIAPTEDEGSTSRCIISSCQGIVVYDDLVL